MRSHDLQPLLSVRRMPGRMDKIIPADEVAMTWNSFQFPNYERMAKLAGVALLALLAAGSVSANGAASVKFQRNGIGLRL